MPSSAQLLFFERRMRHKALMARFLRHQSNIHLLSGMHGNVGDQLIWAGSRDLLTDEGILYREIQLDELPHYNEHGGTLLIPGSGAWTQSWHEWLPDMTRRAATAFSKVVVLPSQFDANVPPVAQCLSEPNVYAFARDPGSYCSIRHIGRSTLAFDCALYCKALECPEGYPRIIHLHNGSLPLVALRTDKDSELSRFGLLPHPELNIDVSRTSPTLNTWIAAIRNASIIVTDRLHVAVAALLLNKRVWIIDPINAKITTYFSYVFRDAFSDRIRLLTADDMLGLGFAVQKHSR